MTSFRQTTLVRCQIARDDVWKWTWPGEGTEIPAAAQVGRRIDRSRLAKVWVPSGGEFGTRVGAVTTIAVCHCVDQIAAQSHERSILSGQIERDWRNVETALNS